MRDPNDAWYVRLPAGRVVRAKSTASVRRHIETGRIPIESWVRRSPDEDWVTLEWAVEFTDVVRQKSQAGEQDNGRDTAPELPGKRGAARGGPELRTVGVRGLAEELLSALDSTLSRKKLAIAALVGLLGSVVVAAHRFLELASMDTPWSSLCELGAGALLLVVGAVSTTLLTQMTFVELSRLRRARWREARARLGAFSVRLLISQLLVGGSMLLVTFALRALPGWVLEQDMGEPASNLLAAGATVVGLILAVLLWPILGLTLLLGPIVIVEECSVARAVSQWLGLVRGHLSRIFLYESLAIALGAVMTLPFLFPVFLAGWLASYDPSFHGITWYTLCVLTGLALTPLIAYLAVANVFIYLNLRYEFSTGQERKEISPVSRRPG